MERAEKHEDQRRSAAELLDEAEAHLKEARIATAGIWRVSAELAAMARGERFNGLDSDKQERVAVEPHLR